MKAVLEWEYIFEEKNDNIKTAWIKKKEDINKE